MVVSFIVCGSWGASVRFRLYIRFEFLRFQRINKSIIKAKLPSSERMKPVKRKLLTPFPLFIAGDLRESRPVGGNV